MFLDRTSPCVREECLKMAQEFEKAIRESENLIMEPMTKFINCANCGIECCGYHATCHMKPKQETDDKDVKTWFSPAICARCNWIADNNGEYGRTPGWRASISKIPW
jgi:hypothetical protein